ncbi:MAG: M56 family metallopeptidase [Vicinamibacteria bacterium]
MDAAARLLLTYLVHSTALLGAAWAACRLLGERRLALQEALLRAALLGGFATAALQVGAGVAPLGGALRLPAAAPERIAADAASPLPLAPAAARAVAVPPRAAPLAAVAADGPAWPRRAAAAVRDAVGVRWREALGLAWATLAALALARIAVASRRLSRLLRGREALDARALPPGLEDVAGSLGLRAPLRISAAPRLSVPLATGILRPEVCLPTRALAELGAEERIALCAHELAHLSRRDPAWILAARLAEGLAPLQPLNTWARRRLQDVAECLSDDLAVAASARPLGLARSLVDVASWTLGEPALLPAAAAGALIARSRLGHRVERLMDPVRRLERPRRLLLPAAAVAVLATALVTPVVSGSASREPLPSAATPQAAASSSATPSAARPSAATPSAERRPTAEERRSAEERLEEISRRIAERARLNEAQMKELEAQLRARAEAFHPNEADTRALAVELEKAARELAVASAARVEAGADRQAQAEAVREAARRMAELQDEMREKAAAFRVPTEEMRALQEQLRAVAERVRPTDAEREELQALSRELVRSSTVESAAARQQVLEEARSQAREARQAAAAAREAAQAAREAMQEAAAELRRATEEMRKSLAEAGARH